MTKSVRTPLPVTFGSRTLTSLFSGRMTLSPDGQRVLYQVHTPLEQTPKGRPRFGPGGVPTIALGQRVHVVEIETGRTVEVGPAGANSWHGSWSPDGTAVAFYSDASGYPQVWLHELASGESEPLSDVRIKAMLWLGDEPQWLPDGSEVVVPLSPAQTEASTSAADDSDGSVSAESQPTVRVYRSREDADSAGMAELNQHFMRENNAAIGAINVRDGSVRLLVPADSTPPPNVAQVSPTGRWVSYLSVFLVDPDDDQPTPASFHDLVVIPAAGGEPTVVARHIPKSAFPPGYCIDTYIWHPTRDQLIWTEDGELWTADFDDTVGVARRLAPELSGLTIAPLLLTRDGESVVVGLDGDEGGGDRNANPRKLAVVPFDKSATVLPLPDELDFDRVVPQSFATAWQPQPDTITVRAIRPATTEQVLLRIDSATGAVVTLSSSSARLTVAGATPDHRTLVAAYEDFRNPGNLCLFDEQGSRGRRLTTVEPRLHDITLGPVETFRTRVPTHTGEFGDATTAVVLPAGASCGDHLPAIMFCYPGGRVSHFSAAFAGGLPSTFPLVPFLERGYAVLLSEAPIGPSDEAGHPLEELAEVLVPQLYRAADLGYVDLERVALAGQSYGGYGTAAAITATHAFRAAIAIQGLYDLTSAYGWLGSGPTSTMFWYFESGQGRMGTHPWADAERYHANSPYHRADRIRTPLLLIHGTDDQMCTVADAGKLYNALKRLGRDVELATYEGEGHVPYEWSRPNAVDALERALDFLDRHLGRG